VAGPKVVRVWVRVQAQGVWGFGSVFGPKEVGGGVCVRHKKGWCRGPLEFGPMGGWGLGSHINPRGLGVGPGGDPRGLRVRSVSVPIGLGFGSGMGLGSGGVPRGLGT